MIRKLRVAVPSVIPENPMNAVPYGCLPGGDFKRADEPRRRPDILLIEHHIAERGLQSSPARRDDYPNARGTARQRRQPSGGFIATPRPVDLRADRSNQEEQLISR